MQYETLQFNNVSGQQILILNNMGFFLSYDFCLAYVFEECEVTTSQNLNLFCMANIAWQRDFSVADSFLFFPNKTHLCLYIIWGKRQCCRLLNASKHFSFYIPQKASFTNSFEILVGFQKENRHVSRTSSIYVLQMFATNKMQGCIMSLVTIQKEERLSLQYQRVMQAQNLFRFFSRVFSMYMESTAKSFLLSSSIQLPGYT